MSGRRSSNPRWLARGIAVAICSLASVGVGLVAAYSSAEASTILAAEAPRLGSVSTPSAATGLDQRPQTREDDRRPNIKRVGPQFVVQPRLVGRDLFFVVSVDPYRTADRHQSVKPDLLRGSVDVSLRGVAIRTVGLHRKSRAEKLIFTTQLKERVVRRAGRIEYRIRLPLSVARSLAATSVRNRTTRVRVVLVHAQDTKPSLRWRETLMLAQSSIGPLPAARSRAATDRLRTAREAAEWGGAAVSGILTNFTPFNLQVNLQPTQCLDLAQWSGTMNPGQLITNWYTVLGSGYNPNGLSTWQNLSQEAVTALGQAAASAGQNAIDEGPASFSPEGAIYNGVTFAADFLVRFITNPEPSCNNTPSTWVVSAVATGLPQPLWQGPNVEGSWAVSGNMIQPVSPPASMFASPYFASIQSGPVQTPAQLASTLGAQTSVQWVWNGGNIVANGAGASYFSGGLIQATTGDAAPLLQDPNFYTGIYYQNNAQNTYGPIQTSNVTMTASQGIDPNEGTPAVNLTCNTGNWSLVSPWGSYSYDLSNPPNSSSASGQLVTSFYYNGTTGSGNSVTGQPIPGVNTIVSGYAGNSQPQVWVDQSTIQSINQSNGGGTITSWGCSVQAQSQVPSFLEPPGWPTNNATSNLSWYSEPMNATTPNPNP